MGLIKKVSKKGGKNVQWQLAWIPVSCLIGGEMLLCVSAAVRESCSWHRAVLCCQTGCLEKGEGGKEIQNKEKKEGGSRLRPGQGFQGYREAMAALPAMAEPRLG